MPDASDSERDACLDAETLAAYIDGALATEVVATAEQHIDRCRSCREEMSALVSVSFPLGTGDAPPVDVDDIPILAGTLGRYRIDREIGRGAMGVVVRARDPELARSVAIKVLTRGFTHGRDALDRLRREAQAMARLSHPNVVQIYDVMVEDDVLAIAMELVEGTTLRDANNAATKTPQELLAICVAAGRGLAAAHAVKLVHSDFKPENVLCADDGRVLVSDFGLARFDEVVAVPTSGPITKTTLAGTPAYMAPEVMSGKPASPSSDQFSFCVTTYETLYGQRPFTGETLEELRANMMSGDVPAPRKSAVTPAIRAALLRGLSGDPAKRFESMDELLDALSPASRSVTRLVLGGAAIAALVAVAAVLAWRESAPSCETAPLAWDRAGLMRALGGQPDESQVIAGIDRHATAWRTARREACEATHIRNELSTRVLDARNACLDRARTELLQLVDLVSHDPALARTAVAAIGKLHDPHDCTADAAVTSADPELSRASALLAAGKAQEAVDVTAQILARPALPPALRAETLLVRGSAEAYLDRYESAEHTLGDALTAAERAGANRVVAETWSELVAVTGAQQNRFEAAQAHMRAAEAAFARADPGPAARARYAFNVALVLRIHGDLDEARAAFERALAGYAPTQIDQLGLIHGELCDVYRRLGDTDKARTECTIAVEMLTAAFGAAHDTLADVYNTWGNLEFDLQQREAAREKWARTIAIYEQRNLVDARTYALALANTGASWNQQRELDKSRPLFERARDLFAKYHPDSVERTIPLSGLASIALTTGDYRTAIAAYEEALAVLERAYGKEDPRRVATLYNVAVAYGNLNDFAKATAFADEVVTVANHPGRENWHLLAYALDLKASLAEQERKDWTAAIEFRERALAALSHNEDAFLHAHLESEIGRTMRDAGQLARSIPHLEYAVAHFTKVRDNLYMTGSCELLLAKSLWDTRRDRKRARALAEAAQTDLAAANAGEELDERRKEVAAWLAAHR
jgi:eukaryotic-like serine/threonine-protein kinase